MADPAPTPAPPSGGNSPVVAIAIAVLMLGGSFAMMVFLLPGIVAKAVDKAMTSAHPTAADVAAPGGSEAPAPGAPAGEGSKEGAPAAGAGATSYSIADVVVNVKGTNASRFVKTDVLVEAPAPVILEIQHNEPKYRDIIASTLSQKSLEELSDPGIRARLRSELISLINPLLQGKGEVKSIYFPSFLIQ